MKKLIAALALATCACGTSAYAADVGISIRLGDPGFYGMLDIEDGYRPRVTNNRPVVVVQRYRNLAPIYLRVPVAQQRQWSRYCDRYNACVRPVYFVRDDWYRDVYTPRYRQQHSQDRRDDRRDDHRDDRKDDRRDDHRDDHRDDKGGDHDRRDDRH